MTPRIVIDAGRKIEVPPGALADLEWSEGIDPTESVDWRIRNPLTYLADAAHLERAPATLYDGDVPIATGYVDGLKAERRAGTLSGVFRPANIGDGNLIPPSSAVVEDEVTFQLPAEGACGTPYPWVYGYPGEVSSSSLFDQGVGSVPCPVIRTVGTGRLMIAGHRTDASARNARVTLVDGEGVSENQVIVREYQDDIGRTYSGISGDDLTVITIQDAGSYAVGFHRNVNGGGGKLINGAPSENPAEILYDILQGSGARIDPSDRALLVSALGGYKFSFWFNQQRGALKLAEELAAWLPIRRIHGPDGLRYVYYPPMPTAEYCEHAFTVGVNAHALEDMTATSEPLASYALDAFEDGASGEYRIRAILTGDANDPDPRARVLPGLTTFRNLDRLAPNVSESCPFTQDSGTAYRIANDRVLARLPSIVQPYRVLSRTVGTPRPGSVVRVNDAAAWPGVRYGRVETVTRRASDPLYRRVDVRFVNVA